MSSALKEYELPEPPELSILSCWGDLANGQAGTSIYSEANYTVKPKEIQIKFLNSNVISCISLGRKHSVIVDCSGQVFTAGCNDSGQLGRPANDLNFAIIQSLQGAVITNTASGDEHTLLLTMDHHIFAFGSNSHGQVGGGMVSEKPGNYFTPKCIGQKLSKSFVGIACGSRFSLALTQESEVYGWGQNRFHQVSLRDDEIIWTPTKIYFFDFISANLFSCGSDHSACITTNGMLYTWGRNNCGQLGLNDTIQRVKPTPVSIPGNSPVTQVSCGLNFTICMCQNGCLYVFGDNSHGQLGLETDLVQTSPIELSWFREMGVTQFACGRRTSHCLSPTKRCLFTCGLKAFYLTEENSGKEFMSTLSTCGKFAPVKMPMISYLNKEKWKTLNPRLFYLASGHNTDSVFLFLSTSRNPYVCSKVSQRDHMSPLSVQKLELNPFSLSKKYMANNSLTDNRLNIGRIVKKIFQNPGNFGQSSLILNSAYYDLKNVNVDCSSLQTAWRKILLISTSTVDIGECVNSLLSNIINMDRSYLPIETLRAIFLLLYIPILPDEDVSVSVAQVFDRIVTVAFFTIPEIRNQMITWMNFLNESSFFTLVEVCRSRVLKTMHNVNFMNLPTKKTQPWFPLMHNLLCYYDILNSVRITKNISSCSEFYIPEIQKSYPYLREFEDYIRDKPPLFVESGYGVNEHTIGNSQMFFIVEHLYMLDTIAKNEILRHEAIFNMKNTIPNNFSINIIEGLLLGMIGENSNPLIVSVNRNEIIYDFVSRIINIPKMDLFRPLKIHFVNEIADDLGGVKEEFFLLFFRELFDAKYDFFVHYNEHRTVWFNPNNAFHSVYYAVGIAVAMAIYNRIIINFPFPIALFKKILNRPLILLDVYDLDNEIGRSLINLGTYSNAEVEDLGLTFSIDQEYQGKIETFDFCPRGRNIAVTANNRNGYVELYVDYIFDKSTKQQFNHFLKGFNMIYAKSVLMCFDPEELRNLVIGCQVYDFAAFEKVTIYKNGYHLDHPVIRMFWIVFHSFDLEMKKTFLMFLTGSDRVPINGIASIPMTIQKVHGGDDTQHLPASHTCYRLLDLPPYRSLEVMRSKLTKALQFSEGFGLT